MIIRAVLAIDNNVMRKNLFEILSRLDVLVEAVDKRHLLWEHISKESGDLIVVSRSLVPSPEEMQVLREMPESPLVIVILEHPDAEEEAAFLAAGCDAVLYSTLPQESMTDALDTILRKHGQTVDDETTTTMLLEAEPKVSDFVSSSPAMHRFMRVVGRVVASDVSLLILGETGVGKERLARAIHAEGPRSAGPFVAVNCGALPESLLESELFGHERGAYTGAARARRGWFEMAHRGTVFLDEIGDLQPHLQVKLLRVLQDHEIQRIGAERSLKVDVRVMAATNRDLKADIEEGRFRTDLFYRLSVVTLTVPPLRERTEDIRELASNYVNYFTSRVGGDVATGISEEAMDRLMQYSWPGNVRELMNVVERALILCEGAQIGLDELPDDVGKPTPSIDLRDASVTDPDPASLPQAFLNRPLRDAKRIITERIERAYLIAHLEATGGKVGETAKRAGIEPRSLHEKMKTHGLRKEDFRPAKRTA